MSKPYFIELYDSTNNNLLGKFKFVLQGTTVKEIKELITQKLIHKNQVDKDDLLTIKDNDDYQLGSGDQVNDVIPDGKVKIYLNKKNTSVQVPSQIIAQAPQPPVLISTNSTTNTNNSTIAVNASSVEISNTTSVLDLSNFKIPASDKSDKFVMNAIIPQIRKSVIQIPIQQHFDNFKQFSEYVVSLLGLQKDLTALLYNSQGCPFVFNLDLLLLNFPKLDYSLTYYIVLTRSSPSWGSIPVSQMQTNQNPSLIRITKKSQLLPLDIKLQIDLSNTLNVLRYRIYQLTQIHPSNQILKFANVLLTNDIQPLSSFNIKADSIIQLEFKLNSNLIPSTLCDKFYYKDLKLVNQQKQQAVQIVRCHLIAMSAHIKQEDKPKFIAAISKYSADLPLAYAFNQLFNNCFLSQTSRIALEEGLFTCIFNYVKGLKTIPVIAIDDVFSYIRNFIGFILETIKKVTDLQQVKKHYSSVNLQNVCTFTLKTIKNPAIVKIDDGQILLVDRESMQQQISKGFTFDHYKKPNKSDLKISSQLLELWQTFLTNHLDNQSFTTLHWLGLQFPLSDIVFPSTNVQINTYLPAIDQYTNLQVNNPLQLKNKVHGYLLIKNKQNRLRVYVSKNKDITKPYNLFDTIKGTQEAVNLDLMGGKTGTENTQVTIDIKTLKPVITRQPKQAIVVLFDISGSMGSKFFSEPDLSRIGAVKSFFQAFAYRTIAYNFQHVVSLIFFDHTIQVQCSFTQSIFDFNTLISNAKPRGSTRLYDSIYLATQNLIQLSKTYPECKLRILALTDGQDNSSSHSVIDTAKYLVQNKIIIDSFAVSTECQGLKNITLASGGKCYLARNLQQSLKLFEQQTVLSVRTRTEEQLKPNVSIQQLLENAKFKPFDEINSVHKFNAPKNKASGVTGKQLTKKFQNQQQTKKIASNGCMKRLVKQIQNYLKDPHPFVSIYPCQDFTFWKMLLLGPKDTPYENGLFLMYVRFPADYPFRAPQVRFTTLIYHCNMNSQGRICHSVLDRNYSPALTMKQIIQCLYGLILTPQPQDPLDNVVASFYLSDYQQYLKNAKEATLKNATLPTEKLVQQLFGQIKDDIERQKKIKQIQQWVEQAKKHN